ncbi:MAG: hypothetical protein RJQ14_03300, partial [Marinoscillum sp.]
HHPNLISPWVFNSAFADPVPPSSEATIALVSIYSNHAITTSTDDFDAGDNLVNIFECYRGYKWTTIHEMLQGDEDWYDYETIILRFNQHPTHELNQNFFIKITMSDGGVFELESNTVITQ